MDIKNMTMEELNKAIEETEQLLWDLREYRMALAVIMMHERAEAQNETVS